METYTYTSSYNFSSKNSIDFMYHMSNSSLTSAHDLEVTYAYSDVDTNGVTRVNPFSRQTTTFDKAEAFEYPICDGILSPAMNSDETQRNAPIVERLVEGCCACKHTFHIPHVGHVPIVERLVEGPCVFKHPSHIRHIRHVPIVERLVEGVCALKHTVHIRHFGHVPLVERLVEGGCFCKHIAHIRHS